MSVAEVSARIDQIRAQLALLAPPTVALPTGGATFAQALARASTASTVQAQSAGGTRLDDAGAAVVAEARKYLGVPYVWGGTDPDTGLDCSALVQLVYRNLGVDLPRVSSQQATSGRPVDGIANARPGDILAFNTPVDHVGIYIGGGRMIEAPRTGLDVRVVDVYETPTAIRRVLPDDTTTGAAQDSGATAAVGASVSGTTPYADLFRVAEARYGVDADLLAAVAKQESSYNPRAVSPAGARGLMQLMPATARALGVEDSFDPAQAVDGAARLLRDLLSEFGRTDLALAAYNAGPGAVHKYDGIPPYPETQNYVRRIMSDLEAR